ncbi:hypothetical protein AB3466_00700 [Sphingobacterium thalpophilum]|uniref:hypothetical protein n=1 Tax=Sphingobacterium thalpophilum TaxID=259 RepID=UPI0037D99D92
MKIDYKILFKNALRKEGANRFVLSADMFVVGSGFIISYLIIVKPTFIILLRLFLLESLIVSRICLLFFVLSNSYKAVVRRSRRRDFKLIGNCVAWGFPLSVMFSYIWRIRTSMKPLVDKVIWVMREASSAGAERCKEDFICFESYLCGTQD